MAKSRVNIVEEWARTIKKNAEKAYCAVTYDERKEYIQKIIGNCEAILATMSGCEGE